MPTDPKPERSAVEEACNEMRCAALIFDRSGRGIAAQSIRAAASRLEREGAVGDVAGWLRERCPLHKTPGPAPCRETSQPLALRCPACKLADAWERDHPRAEVSVPNFIETLRRLCNEQRRVEIEWDGYGDVPSWVVSVMHGDRHERLWAGDSLEEWARVEAALAATGGKEKRWRFS